MGDSVTWVSLKEAAERAAVSVSWLRKQYRQNGLPTRETIGSRGPQKAVPLEEVVRRAATFVGRESPARDDAPRAPAPMPPLAETGAPDVQMLLDRLAGIERERSLIDRLVEAERRAAQAQAEAAYLRLRLEDAFAEVESLRDALSST